MLSITRRLVRLTPLVGLAIFLVAASVSAWGVAPVPGAWSPASAVANGSGTGRFEPLDVFELEWASDPQISPNGEKIVYVRNFMDIAHDRRRSNLWIIDYGGSAHRPLTTGDGNDSSPRWSPDGERLLYVSREDGSTQIYVRWMDSGQTARISHMVQAPRGITWSPDGRWVAFSALVKAEAKPFAKMPPKPEGAEWSKPPRVIDKLIYRRDGQGYVEDGYTQLFVLPAEGGTPRQVTSGAFNHNGRPVWSHESEALIFSANRHDDWEYDPVNSEIYDVLLEGGAIRALTDRTGPDNTPALSRDGKKIAYLGFDDRLQGYQVTRLYIMDRDGANPQSISGDFDRSVEQPVWAASGRGLYFRYDDYGNTKVGYVTLGGKAAPLVSDVGGVSIGRPYTGGTFSVAGGGRRFVFTQTQPGHPADIAVGKRGIDRAQRITHLNDDLLGHKQLGVVEEIYYESSFDERPLQGWIVKPPGFDPAKKYPLILEIHGGPFANYGDRFSAEIQLYAAAGYVVFYTNPRGSTSYGEEFGNLIHYNYPGEDYDDLMSGVDAVIERGYIDTDNLFVTGGSGGGVLTAWIVGKTGRFRAAVVAKPVINWYSFVLTSDAYNFFYKYWFPGFPWEYPEHYLKRSPLSLVGNVTTPTMLLTGENDYRTPISETEQFYQALKLRRIEAVLVRIPGASHGITARPGNLIAKVTHVLEWFERHRTQD